MVGGDDAVLIVDDTSLPKKGAYSVGVAPQYASVLGKNANCQTLVSLTLARGEVPAMVGLRLFLPESWTSDDARLARAGVPEDRRGHKTKPEIAIEEIDRLRAAGLGFGCVLADAGYGLSAPFWQALSARGLLWAVGIPHKQKVYPADVAMVFPVASRGRPRKNHVPDVASTPAQVMLESAQWLRLSWRRGVKGKLEGRFAAIRVRVADGEPQRIGSMGAQHLPGEEVWLVGERRSFRREEVLPLQLQPTSAQTSRRRHQGALGLRASASADEGGAWARPLRGAVMARAAQACTDEHDRLPLPPVRRLAEAKREKRIRRNATPGPPPQPSLPAIRSASSRPSPNRHPHARGAAVVFASLICQ